MHNPLNLLQRVEITDCEFLQWLPSCDIANLKGKLEIEKLNFVNDFPPRAAATGLRLPLHHRLLVERRGREDLGGSRLAALETARVGATPSV